MPNFPMFNQLCYSNWGKFCENPDCSSVTITTTPEEFHKVLEDPTLKLIDVRHLSDATDRIVHRKKNALVESPRTNNLPVACFVTAQARLCLYDYIQEAAAAGFILLYCDTDSLYYVRKLYGVGIRQGNRLGQMSREYGERRLIEFVCAGPKNYGFRHTAPDGSDRREVLKIRGVRLNYNAQRSITFDNIRRLILRKFDGLEGRYVS
jgi:hypothetical protein